MPDNSSSDFSLGFWVNFPACISLFTLSFASYILLLPLFTFVLFTGIQRARKQPAGATSEMASHSDIFTYNMASIEVVSILGSCFYCYGIYTGDIIVLSVGLSLWSIISPAQILFHLLTCAERYLAAVHPVTYRGLKVSGGVMIRNISIGCVWMISLVSPTLEAILGFNQRLKLMFMLVSSIIVCFFSISVLCTLRRATPGETSSNRGRVDQSKHKVVHTVMAIMGALMLKFLSCSVQALLNISLKPNPVTECLITWCVYWFAVPSSLVLPLLFLQRVGKVPCARKNRVST